MRDFGGVRSGFRVIATDRTPRRSVIADQKSTKNASRLKVSNIIILKRLIFCNNSSRHYTKEVLNKTMSEKTEIEYVKFERNPYSINMYQITEKKPCVFLLLISCGGFQLKMQWVEAVCRQAAGLADQKL